MLDELTLRNLGKQVTIERAAILKQVQFEHDMGA